MTPLARLDDLLASSITEEATPATAPVDDWGMGKHYRPDDKPHFALDWAARMYDAGTSYSVLIDWFLLHAFHLRPRSQADDLRERLGTRLPPEQPMATTLAIMRLDGESDRAHLLRAGHQAPVYDVPGQRVSRRDRPYESIFFFRGTGGTPSLARQLVIAESPVSLDRAALLQRGATPRSVLLALVRDPNPAIRRAVVHHRKSDAAVLARFAGPGYTETNHDVVSVLVMSRRTEVETLLALVEPSGLPITKFVAKALVEHGDPRLAALGCRLLAAQGGSLL